MLGARSIVCTSRKCLFPIAVASNEEMQTRMYLDNVLLLGQIRSVCNRLERKNIFDKIEISSDVLILVHFQTTCEARLVASI